VHLTSGLGDHPGFQALYDGGKPGWDTRYGALPFAAFTAGVDQSEQACVLV
jgi:hypothetical protein